MSNDWLNAPAQKAGVANNEELKKELVDEANRVFGTIGVKVSHGNQQVNMTDPERPAAPESDTCAQCAKKIEGRCVVAMGKSWHSECFSCCKCNRSFDMNDEPYAARTDPATGAAQPWCRRCVEFTNLEKQKKYLEPVKLSNAPVRLSGGFVAVQSGGAGKLSPAGNTAPTAAAPAAADAPEEPLVWCSVNIRTRVYHETAPGQLDDSLKSLKLGKQTGGADDVVDICIKCGQAINDPEFITSASGKYHEGCFFCAACGILIEPEQGHVNDNGQPYHKECHLQAKASRCTACGKPLVGKYNTTKDGSKYHKECFVCHVCQAPNSLAEGYLMRDNKPTCGLCAKNYRPGQVAAVAAAPAPVTAASVPQPAAAAAAGAGGGKKFCTGCGSPVTSKFCAMCGAAAPQ